MKLIDCTIKKIYYISPNIADSKIMPYDETNLCF